MSLSDLICKRLHVAKTFVTDWVQHTGRIVPKACHNHIPHSWSWNAAWEDVARTAALPPNLGQNIEAHGEPVANAKDVVTDESKEGNHRLTDLPLCQNFFLFYIFSLFFNMFHLWSSTTSNLVTPCDTRGRWHCWRMRQRGCAAKSCTARPSRPRRMTAMPLPWQRRRPKRSQLCQKLRKNAGNISRNEIMMIMMIKDDQDSQM